MPIEILQKTAEIGKRREFSTNSVVNGQGEKGQKGEFLKGERDGKAPYS